MLINVFQLPKWSLIYLNLILFNIDRDQIRLLMQAKIIRKKHKKRKPHAVEITTLSPGRFRVST